MEIGYIRVSTDAQEIDLQKNALEQIGCTEIFIDICSGAKSKRPNLDDMMNRLRRGDRVTVWRLDRFGRSLKDLLLWIEKFEQIGVEFRSLQEGFDTSTSGGKLVFQIFGAIAEFERNLISERTKAGLDAAKRKGKKGGRPKGLSKEKKAVAKAVQTLHSQGELSVSEIRNQFNISKGTFYNYLKLEL